MSDELCPDDASPRTLRTISARNIKPRRVRWLWDQRIVLGGLTLLAGREGLGKSTLAVDIAAQITRGELPGEFQGTPRTVIYVNSEDARDYTIVPRLIAAGADLDKVLFVDAIIQDEGNEMEMPLVLPHDTALLAQEIERHDAALVVLDAATSVIDGRLDGNKDRQMRIGLERIAKVGESTGAAVLGIVHFGKRESADTGKLIIGTIAWSQVARSVVAVARDDDSGDLVISTTKANLGAGAPSLSAHILSSDVSTSEGITSVGYVKWSGETERNARDLLGENEAAERSETSEAAEWLRGYLIDEGGSAPAGDVLKAARQVGLAERTVQRARKHAGVTTRKAGQRGWAWSLEPDTQGANEARS